MQRIHERKQSLHRVQKRILNQIDKLGTKRNSESYCDHMGYRWCDFYDNLYAGDGEERILTRVRF